MSWPIVIALCCMLMPLPSKAEQLDFTPKLGLQFIPELGCTDKKHTSCNKQLPQGLEVTAPVVEDPDWYVSPPGSSAPKPRYVGCQSGAQYLRILTEALNGNPVAMADLVMHIQCASSTLATTHPGIPVFMHSKDFWLDWAAQYSSPGWVYARLALYNEGIGNTRSAYTRGAFLGDPKSMHAYATHWNTGTNLQWLILSADAGYAPAALEISRLYHFGGNKCGYTLPNSPNELMARQYLSIALNGGDARAYGVAVYEILTSEDAQAQMEDAYAYTQIGHALAEADNGLLLPGRPLPKIEPVTLDDVLGYARYALLPFRFMNLEKKHSAQALKSAQKLHPLEAQDVAAATKKATAWLRSFQALREANLKTERERRNALTIRLREQCLSAITYIAAMSDTNAPNVHTQDDALTASRISSPSQPLTLP